MNITQYAKRMAELAKRYPDAKLVFVRTNDNLTIFEVEEVKYLPGRGEEKEGKFTPSVLDPTVKVNAVCIN